MQLLTSNTMKMMERSVDFLWMKQTAILDNIANSETPNYKTKYVTFEEALNAQLQKADSIAEMQAAIDTATPTLHVAENESARMDGNGVDLNEQSIELSRTGYQMQYVFQSISSDIALLRSAIRGQ